MRRQRWGARASRAAAVLAVTALASLGLVVGGTTTAAAASASASKSLTVLEPSATTGSWNGLDPATDSLSALDYDYMNAVYGELFEEGPHASVVPDLATGYKLTDGDRELDITLRRGVTFTDGTPFDAAAVKDDFDRDFSKSVACICDESFSAVTSTTTVGKYEVVLHLSHPDLSIVQAFFAEAPDWIYSPTALAKMGEKAFSVKPVGAGPFEVVADTLSNRLVLKANPHYWQKGLPKLKKLTFLAVGSDESGYLDLRSGTAQVDLGLTTPSIRKLAKSTYAITSLPATGTYSVNLNPNLAPLNNILAREALQYATNVRALDAAIDGDTGVVSESGTGPADQFWTPRVTGYRTYDPAAAKRLVKELGGSLDFTLVSLPDPTDETMADALQTEWAAVGIDAKISIVGLTRLIQEGEEGEVESEVTAVGAVNPSLLPGVDSNFESSGLFSYERNAPGTAKIDAILAGAASTTSLATEAALYKEAFVDIDQEAFAVFLYTENSFNLADRPVTGIGDNLAEINWQDVGV